MPYIPTLEDTQKVTGGAKPQASGGKYIPTVADTEQVTGLKAVATQQIGNDLKNVNGGAGTFFKGVGKGLKSLIIDGELPEIKSDDELSPLLISAGKGMLGVGRGARQLGKKARIGFNELIGDDEKAAELTTDLRNYEQGINDELALLKPLEDKYPIQTTVGEIGGAVTAELPLGFLGVLNKAQLAGKLLPKITPTTSTVNRILQGAAKGGEIGAKGGAVSGALAYDPTSENRVSNTIGGGAMGAGTGGAIGSVLGALSRYGVKPGLDSTNNAAIDEAADRIKTFKETGAPATQGILTGNPTTMFKEEALRLKSADSDQGKRMLQRTNQQQEWVNNKLGELQSDISKYGDGFEQAGEKVQKVLMDKADDMRSRVVQGYETALKGMSGMPIDKDALAQRYAQDLGNYPAVDSKIPRNIKIELDDVMGEPVIKKTQEVTKWDADANSLIKREYNNETITKILGVRPAELTDTQPFDMKRLGLVVNKINQAMGKNKGNPETYDLLKDLRKTTLDYIDEQADSLGLSAENELLKSARTLRREVDTVFQQKDMVEDIVRMKSRSTQKYAPEEVANKILNREGFVTNFNKIEKALLYDDKTGEGKQAFDGIRRQVVSQLMDMSTNQAGQFNPNKFIELVDKKLHGEKTLEKLIGDPKVSNELKSFIKVVKYYQPKTGTKNPPNTAPFARQLLTGIPFTKTLTKFLESMDDARFNKANEAFSENPTLRRSVPEGPTANAISPTAYLSALLAAQGAANQPLPEQRYAGGR